MANKKLTFKQQMKGFPWGQIAVVSLVRFGEPIAFTSLFPYVYYMVKDFHVAPDDAQVSKYSGYLSSVFSLSQVLAAYTWGSYADKKGRKITLVIGLLGTIVALLTLGFSKYFYQALLARTIMGLLNGNVGVLRTVIGEIAVERRHQALAFSTMPLLFQFGCVIGPMIGGFLVFRQADADIIPKWFPKWLQRLIEKYPYCLPNIVISILLIFGVFCAILFLEETHPDLINQRDRGLEIGDLILKYLLGVPKKQRPWNNPESAQLSSPITDHSRDSPTESSPLLDDDDIGYDSEADSIHSLQGILTRRQSVGLIRTYSLHEPTDLQEPDALFAEDGCLESSMWHHVFHTAVFYPISVNFIQSLHVIVYNEFLPVFLAYSLAMDPNDPTKLASKFPWKITGGIGYTPEQTGTLLSTTGIFGCFVVLVIFPWVDRRFDCLTIFRTLTKLYPIMYVMVPYVVFLQTPGIPRWATIIYLYVITCIKTFAGALNSPQIMLLIHHNSPLSCRATINGATISIQAGARFVGPIVWGYLIAWSQENNVAWVSWWTLGFFAIIAIYQSYKIAPIDDDTEEEGIIVEEVIEEPGTGLSRRVSRISRASTRSKRGLANMSNRI